jgi:large subunit ribosomal protein L3
VKAACEPQRFVREFRGSSELQVGGKVTVAVLEGVGSVDVTGTSRGRGYSGVMKRHNFSGQRATHGVKKCHRHPGGTSMNTYPGRTFKGKKMAGHYGNAKTTSRNLKVVKVDVENNLLLVHGAVPGPRNGYVVVRETNCVG